MPNTRISDLTAATSVAGTDVYPSVQTAGVGPVKTSLTQITAFALANAPAGAVATPSIAPTGDTNTGFWFPAADTIAASTGGSERMRITSAGNVGIGVTPNAWDTNLYGQLQLMNGYTAVYSDGAYAGVGGIAYNAYWSSTAGPVPTWKYTNSNRAGRYEFNGLVGGAGTHAWFTAPSGTAGADITFTQVMTISSAGNVGIGTTSPSARLHVSGGAGLFERSYSGTSPLIQILNSSTSGASALYDTALIQADDVPCLRIVEITGGSSSAEITIAAGDGSAGNVIGSTSSLIFATGRASGTVGYLNTNERMRITSAGNLLIGTTSSPTTGTQCLTVGTGTAPTATPADTVTFYSSDLSAGNTMPSFYTEGTIVGTGTPTADRTIAVRINGTVYYLLASTIP